MASSDWKKNVGFYSFISFIFETVPMNNEDNDYEQSNLISHLRTIIILAARNSPSSDIEIAAVDKIVETTIDFIKNLLEQMAKETNSSSFSSDDLLNTIRVRSISSFIYSK